MKFCLIQGHKKTENNNNNYSGSTHSCKESMVNKSDFVIVNRIRGTKTRRGRINMESSSSVMHNLFDFYTRSNELSLNKFIDQSKTKNIAFTFPTFVVRIERGL